MLYDVKGLLLLTFIYIHFHYLISANYVMLFLVSNKKNGVLSKLGSLLLFYLTKLRLAMILICQKIGLGPEAI